MRWLYLPYYMHYRQFPNRMVKVYTPQPPTSINPWLARNKECLQLTTALGEFCLIILICFDLFGSWDWASRLPALSREWGAESTPLENNPPSMEDIGSPSWNMSCSSIQNRISFEGLEFGTYKFTWNGRLILHIGRYGGLIWNNFRVYGSVCTSSIPA